MAKKPPPPPPLEALKDVIDSMMKNMPYSETELQYKQKSQDSSASTPFAEGASSDPTRPVLVHESLGEGRTDMIANLHRGGAIATLPHMTRHLYEWQKHGAWMTHISCEGPMKAVLNCSQMGTGKTLETIVAAEYARLNGSPGCFTLILTTRSCIPQWVDEIESSFEETGGAGLKLVFASKQILYETSWNVQDEAQIIGRHRGGQTKGVHVFRLIAANPAIDALMLIAKERKWKILEPFMESLRVCGPGGRPPHIPQIAK
ncbi:hypothetical protein P280DRAFT_513112 [Massarina eburnea CBS 473.64]|uniref:Helicase ATP-binding domain-containing protein n=1 Tax=Massarina eburnea CBS 473.64 TaxID=1395130 RepID=A0A6A6SBL6_9PLEO|nr:hypothetical protein P280DRAFT_513112 [Massarina eburnea CBS 473.64]